MVLQVNRCLSIKGAEDVINKPYAFEISTTDSSMYFVADKDKVTKQTSCFAQVLLYDAF